MDTYIELEIRNCKGCGKCVEVCPTNELYLTDWDGNGTIVVATNDLEYHNCHHCEEEPCKQVCDMDVIDWERW